MHTGKHKSFEVELGTILFSSLCFVLFFKLSSLNVFQLQLKEDITFFLTLGKEAKLFDITNYFPITEGFLPSRSLQVVFKLL